MVGIVKNESELATLVLISRVSFILPWAVMLPSGAPHRLVPTYYENERWEAKEDEQGESRTAYDQ